MKYINYSLLKSSFYLFSILVLSSCTKPELSWTENTTLKDTEWVITRYDNTLTNNSEFPLDTLTFIDENTYQINGGAKKDYYLNSVNAGAQDEYHFHLSDCSTFGGDYGSWIDQFSIDEGEIKNKLFNSGDNEIIVWMEKI